MSAPSDAMPAAATTSAAPAKTRPLFWSVAASCGRTSPLLHRPPWRWRASSSSLLREVSRCSTCRTSRSPETSRVLDPLSALAIGLAFVSMAIILTSMLVGVFYWPGRPVHNERRDRSILFWKSLPVSDVDHRGLARP